jgi:hypothetical protein
MQLTTEEEEGHFKRPSSPFVVRHTLAASWKDSEFHYPEEDGGDMFLRNVSSY